MRPSSCLALIGAAFLAIALVLVPSARGARAKPVAACDHDCLVDMMNRYVDAMVVQRDPAVLPLSPQFKATENGKPAKLGEGLWKTVVAVPYRQIFADPRAGQVGLYAVMNEGGPLTIAAVRLKVAAGRIAESETLYARKGEVALFAPEAMTRPDPIYSEVVPLNRRTPRAAMIAAAASYYDGIEKADGSKVLSAAGCWRVENGVQMQAVPADVVAGDCKAGLKVFGFISAVRDRRFPIVDEEHGLVWAQVVMDSKPGARNPNGSSSFVWELFKVVDGRTRRMEVVWRNLPFATPIGWPAG